MRIRCLAQSFRHNRPASGRRRAGQHRGGRTSGWRAALPKLGSAFLCQERASFLSAGLTSPVCWQGVLTRFTSWIGRTSMAGSWRHRGRLALRRAQYAHGISHRGPPARKPPGVSGQRPTRGDHERRHAPRLVYGRANVFVEVYTDQCEVVSPGGLPRGLSLADLGSKSVRRKR